MNASFGSKFVTKAPAKVILTGDHSVVYGKPAIVSAVNRFAFTEILPCTTQNISFNLHDLKQKASATIRTLRLLKEHLLESYHKCLKGELTIRQVLNTPSELFQFACISVLDVFRIDIQKGFNVTLRSEIPMGCGMGSSAATIVSVIHAIANFFSIEIKTEWLFRLSIEAEKLQHGYSSGVDSYISLNGGCVRFQNGKAERLSVSKMRLALVNTGKPQSSTGECVMQVKKNFAISSIWDEFESIAELFYQAITSNDTGLIQSITRLNHQLLVQIGVVPQKITTFIKEIESHGGAAKICGAGAVTGDAAGIVLTWGTDNLEPICHKYGYSVDYVEGEDQGARII